MKCPLKNIQVSNTSLYVNISNSLIPHFSYFRIIQAVDDLTIQLQSTGAMWSASFIREFVTGQVWQQTGYGDLTIGISLTTGLVLGNIS